MRLTCRFYQNRFPDPDDVVMVQITRIQDDCVFVNLLEYNNQEAMILSTELSRRRIPSVTSLVRVGRKEAAMVIRVDSQRGNIDLSKCRVTPTDVTECQENFARGRLVNTIVGRTAEIIGITSQEELEDLFQRTAWFFDEKYQRVGAAHDVFVRAAANEHELDDCRIDQTTRTALLKTIRHHLATTAVKCQANINLTCYGYEGIDGIKKALRAGLSVSTDDIPIKITLIASPLYAVSLSSLDAKTGLTTLNNSLLNISNAIRQYDGAFFVAMAPRVINVADEIELENDSIRKFFGNNPNSNDEVEEDDDDEATGEDELISFEG